MVAPPESGRSRSLGKTLGAAELGLVLLEGVLVLPPVLALAGKSILASPTVPFILSFAAALWVVSVVRLADGLRPVLAVRSAKSRNVPINAAQAELVRVALERVPTESG